MSRDAVFADIQEKACHSDHLQCFLVDLKLLSDEHGERGDIHRTDHRRILDVFGVKGTGHGPRPLPCW